MSVSVFQTQELLDLQPFILWPFGSYVSLGLLQDSDRAGARNNWVYLRNPRSSRSECFLCYLQECGLQLSESLHLRTQLSPNISDVVTLNGHQTNWSLYLYDVGQTTYLVGEREGEDQNLAAQLPFRFILHVGHLDFDGDRTLVEQK